MSVNVPQSVQLSAETYSGGTNAILFSGDIITIRQLLDTDCAYYDKDGKLFTGGLVNTSLHAVTVTVDGEDLGEKAIGRWDFRAGTPFAVRSFAHSVLYLE